MPAFKLNYKGLRFVVCGLLYSVLVCLLAACGSVALGSSPSPTATATPSSTRVPLLTTCPADGTARATHLESIHLGTDARVIYTADSVLESYHTESRQKSQILAITPFTFQLAQISPDGQWVLFLATYPQQPSKLQLVRVDGQKLQTIYCSPATTSFSSIQWSLDQHSILLETYNGSTNSNVITQLNTTNGKLQTEIQTAKGEPSFKLVQWLDATRVYVLKSDAQQQGLYLLDTSKEHKLNGSDLPVVQTFPTSTGNTYTDIKSSDIDTDGQQLYIGLNHTITAEPVTGGTQQNIYSDTTHSVQSVRATSAHSLIFITFVANGGFGSYDVWKINTDGTGLVHIASNNGVHTYYGFNDNAPYTWTNASRSGQMLTFMEVGNMSGYNALHLAASSGGTVISIATGGPTTHVTRIDMVGWTTNP